MTHFSQPRQPHPDDIVLWPDGSWTTREKLENGHYDWKSDDYEIIDHTDEARLAAVGIMDEIM